MFVDNPPAVVHVQESIVEESKQSEHDDISDIAKEPVPSQEVGDDNDEPEVASEEQAPEEQIEEKENLPDTTQVC